MSSPKSFFNSLFDLPSPESLAAKTAVSPRPFGEYIDPPEVKQVPRGTVVKAGNPPPPARHSRGKRR